MESGPASEGLCDRRRGLPRAPLPPCAGRAWWDVASCDVAWGRDMMDRCSGSAQDTSVYDLVIHAAAWLPHRVAIDTQPATLVYNQTLDAVLFDWAIRTRQRHVLYLSSCAAADDQPDSYGLLKLTGERMAEQARAAGLNVTVVRPYSGYGEDQSEDFPFGASSPGRERARTRSPSGVTAARCVTSSTLMTSWTPRWPWLAPAHPDQCRCAPGSGPHCASSPCSSAPRPATPRPASCAPTGPPAPHDGLATRG